ncbi:hypothetical protein [Lutibacter sp. B1]|uniref:hypothetical protein n=1 Tax=Lutibacter sp. B1 TaxID=2725996 RepID=UPI001457311B|nr:hypothetical protein [Lutibacter sp. B1]NLP56679.1 hypothetical protein [Lutibacter sp. B1]
MKNYLIVISFFLNVSIAFSQLDENSVMGIPSGTASEINAVTTATAGSIAYNTESKKIMVFDGTIWVNTTNSSNENWLITGNNLNASDNNFLGTTNDVKMQIRSNNTPMLEFGRRQTLGLDKPYPDYERLDQPLVYVKGDGNTAGLQFAASGASFYKPIFFTTANGSFRLKGSAGGTDLFEIGSAGPNNDGRLEFVIGDDGAEPIIFKRYDYRDQTNKELFRVQGSDNSASAKTRFGININPSGIAIDQTYNDAQTSLNIANSTFQVNGSVSKSIISTTGNLTLTEDHHTIILEGNHAITLPTANSCTGRIYIIKNKNDFATTISSYINEKGVSIQTINNNSVLWIQSDGADWQQITATNVVSSDANNAISVGTDGGAYQKQVYEKIVIWADENGTLSDNNLQWSFGNGATGQIGIPLPEAWEAYAVSFNAANTNGASETVKMAIIDSDTNTNLFTFTASGSVNNMVYTEILTTPISIPAGTSLGFRTVTVSGTVKNVRVAVFLRRLPD